MRGILKRCLMAGLFVGSVGAGVAANAAQARAQEERTGGRLCWNYDEELCPGCCPACEGSCPGSQYVCCLDELDW